jgi:hypothetical protein
VNLPFAVDSDTFLQFVPVIAAVYLLLYVVRRRSRTRGQSGIPRQSSVIARPARTGSRLTTDD